MIFEPFHDNKYCHLQLPYRDTYNPHTVKVCFRNFFSILLKKKIMMLNLTVEFATPPFFIIIFKVLGQSNKQKAFSIISVETYWPNCEHE